MSDASKSSPAVDALIYELGLKPHPEGGWFRETFRDPEKDASGRNASTAIYYLLAADQVSAWHRVDAVEAWHFYAGAPLELRLARPKPNGVHETLVLGPDIAARQRPQVVIDRHWWQSAKSLGDWTLVGCTVAPGFDFNGFEMAPDGWEP